MEHNTNEDVLEFKSPIRKLHDLIFLGSLALLSLLMVLFFGFTINYLHPLLITVFGFGVYYLLLYKISCPTIIKVNDGILTITQDSSLLNFTKTITLELKDVRGFEVNEITRGAYALIIYTNSRKYYKYPIIRAKDLERIRTCLQQYLKTLTYKTNPYFKSWVSAYLFAFKRCLIFVFSAGLLITFLYFISLHYGILKNNIPAYVVFAFLISIILWWQLVQIPVKNHSFRFGAFYWFSNIFIYASAIVFVPMLLKYSEIKEVPISLTSISQLHKQKPSSLFFLENAKYDPIKILIYGNEAHNIRSVNFKLKHTFLTPLFSENKIIDAAGHHKLWLIKTYEQYIKKSLPGQVKEKMAYDFYKQSEASLMKSFESPAKFYKATTTEDRALSILKRHNFNTSEVTIIEPHWEKLCVYKFKKQKELIWCILAIIILNLVGSIFISVYR
jgi:hypothetical protein